MFLHASSNVWESMADTVFAIGIQQPLELGNSCTEFQLLECHVTCVWAFWSSMLYLQKAWSVSTLNTLKAHVVSFAGQHAQVIWQHAIQVLGEQRKSHFLAQQIDSVLPLEIQRIFFSLYWARTPSEYHKGTPVRSPMNLHQPTKCLLATERSNPGSKTGSKSSRWGNMIQRP